LQLSTRCLARELLQSRLHFGRPASTNHQRYPRHELAIIGCLKDGQSGDVLCPPLLTTPCEVHLEFGNPVSVHRSQDKPGQIQLSRMVCLVYSEAICLVSITIPALERQQRAIVGDAPSACVNAVLMMTLPPSLSITGTAY
jgi:hypothetical protein